jgi:hypothetical protein
LRYEAPQQRIDEVVVHVRVAENEPGSFFEGIAMPGPLEENAEND